MKVLESLWRGASRRWRQAVLIAVAVVLPGSVGAGTMAMMPSEADPSSVPGLDGTLPFQDDTALEPFLDAEMLAAVPVGADPVSEPVRAVLSSARVIDSLGESGIPAVAVDAYVMAAARLEAEDPTCGIRWTLLAAIGRVESNHGRFGGALLRDDGYSTKPIRGIPLDGRPNVALIRDTDDGALDGDTAYDRAVGPMQFIPSTWRSAGVDADGDGRRDPDNIFDAAYGAARYLCAGDTDLRNADARAQAVRLYNNADEYVRVVLNLADMYETGAVEPLPAIGLPPMEPTPPPRPSPGPPRPSPAPDGPSGPAPAARNPAPPAPARPVPSPATPAPTTTPTSTPPTPPAPTTTTPTTPAPTSPPTTPPAPTTSSTTSPSTTSPSTTTPEAPSPTTTSTTTTTVPPDPPAEPPAVPEDPPAAVGWAPAMREVVIEILDETAEAPAAPALSAPVPPASAAPPAAEPPAPAAPPEPPGPATPPEPPTPAAPSAPPESPAPAEPPPS